MDVRIVCTSGTRTTRSGSARGCACLAAVVALIALAACGGGDAASTTDPPDRTEATAVSSTVAETTSTSTAPTTTVAATLATTTTTSTTTTSTVPTTEPAGPVESCRRYVDELIDLVGEAAVLLQAGAEITGRLADGSLSEADGAAELTTVSTDFGVLVDRVADLGEPPPEAAAVAALVGDSLAHFTTAYDLQAQGAAAGDATLIDQGTAQLDEGAALLADVPAAMPDCSAAGDPPAPSGEFATPDELDLTVFFRLAETLLGDSAYEGTSPEVLTESAQASCRVLLDGGDVRSAIEAAIASSPAAGQSFGSDEQILVLFVVTRGAGLWCPSVIEDEEMFKSEVISTIVDVFFDS